jgi:hypothetical protein
VTKNLGFDSIEGRRTKPGEEGKEDEVERSSEPLDH